MNQEMVERLSVITREEQDILRGNREIDRTLYMDRGDMVIDSRKLLHAGKMITIRPHTRVPLPIPTTMWRSSTCARGIPPI